MAHLSDYELARMNRITQQKALLSELKLDETVSPTVAPSTSASAKILAAPAPNARKRYSHQPQAHRQPTRRSLRIAAANERSERTSQPARRTRRSHNHAGEAKENQKEEEEEDGEDKEDEEDEDDAEEMELRSACARRLLHAALGEKEKDEEKDEEKEDEEEGGDSRRLPWQLSYFGCVRPLRKRVFSVGVSGCRRDGRLLGAAGDTHGNVGLFCLAVDSDGGFAESQSPTPTPLPVGHARAVTRVAFAPRTGTPELLLTAGYDGLACAFHLGDGGRRVRLAGWEEAVTAFDTVRGGGGGQDDRADVWVLGFADGGLRLCDRREDQLQHRMLMQDGRRSVKCVDLKCGSWHECLTANQDGTVRLWDLRQTKRALRAMDHGRSVDSAYWSTDDGGQRFVTTSLNNEVRVYNADCSLQLSIAHNNDTTRYLSNFRAVWLPGQLAGQLNRQVLTIGSMNRPIRRVEFFCPETGQLLGSLSHDHLTTVTSIVVWHPACRCLFGANSSGKIFVFADL